MKKLLILACALVIASSAVAAQGKRITSKYSGLVEKYDVASKTLTVKRKDNKQGDFVMNDTSEILDGKAKADVAALTAGRKVDVQFYMDGATKVVVKAKVSGAATTK